MAKFYSRFAPRLLRWSVTVALGFSIYGAPSAAWAGALNSDAPLPPMARVQAERGAVTSAQGGGRFEPAPTPNQNVLAPRGIATSGPVFSPSMFRQTETYRGDGYTQGSSQQVTQEPRKLPLPGFSLKVPLN